MPKVRVDFSQAREFEALPVGDYPVVVEDAEIREGAKGPYINWTLKVETGEFAGRKLWLVSSLSPNATWSLKANLRALGETNEDIVGPHVTEADIDPDDYVGNSAVASVIQEEYQNRMQNRVTGLAPFTAAASGRRGAAAIR